MLDFDSGDRDTGDHDSSEVSRRVVDVWHPSFQLARPAAAPVAPTETGRKASKQAVEAARMLARRQAMLEQDMEAVRAAFWNRIPQRTRQMVCHMAGIDANKGKGPLLHLDAAERAKIHAEIKRMLPDLDAAMKCATGGKTHDHGEMAGHALNGITAGGTIQ